MFDEARGRGVAQIAGQTELSAVAQDREGKTVEAAISRLTISLNGILAGIGPATKEQRPRIIAHAMREYERCHPGDSFANLVERARFSKEDKGLLRDWLDAFEHATASRLQEQTKLSIFPSPRER